MTKHHMPKKRWAALFDDLRCLLDRLEESWMPPAARRQP